jgi:hypothetical protein
MMRFLLISLRLPVKEGTSSKKSSVFNHDGRAIAAGEFPLEAAIAAFGLQYSSTISFSKPWVWKVEEIPETKGFELSKTFL